MANSNTKRQRTAKTTPSSVCRINKNENYTVMSNYHLRSLNLSLKAIGLLSKVLSLPRDWDYSVSGLTSICKEKETAIKAALDELKLWGYLKVTKLMPNETNSGRIEYVYDFYEYSEKDDPDASGNIENSPEEEKAPEKTIKQEREKQGIENLPLEILPVEFHGIENQGQINKEYKIKNNKLLSNKSIYQSSDKKGKNEKSLSVLNDRPTDYVTEQKIYTDVVKSNIEFDYLKNWLKDNDEAEQIVQMIVKQICSRKPQERICKEDYPRETVKAVMLKADIVAVQNTISQMQHAEEIKNFEKYFISTLFNEICSGRFKENCEVRWAQSDLTHGRM